MIFNHRIEHATIVATTTIVNNTFTTKYTFDIRPENHNYVINTPKLHQNTFEAIKQNWRDCCHHHTRQHPHHKQHHLPHQQRTQHIIPRPKTMQSTKTNAHIIHTGICIQPLSNKILIRIKSTNVILETLRENLAPPSKWRNTTPGKKASIEFLLEINPKLTLRKALKQKIDELCLWLDLDDEDTKHLIKETTLNKKTSQSLVIPTIDIHNKEFGTGTDNKRITSKVYEIRNSPDNKVILKIILCKASHPNSNPTILLIPYGIQGITNKDHHSYLRRRRTRHKKSRN